MYRFENGEEATRKDMLNILELLQGCISEEFNKSCLASMCLDDLKGFVNFVFDQGYDTEDIVYK